MINFGYFINVGNYNLLFNEYSFDNTNINLTVNNQYLSYILEQNVVSPMYLQNDEITPNGFNYDSLKPFKYRLLEIAAFSIFENASCRAAITDQYNTNLNLDAFTNTFFNEKENIYNQYITLNRESNLFNFSGINFTINYYVNGHTYGVNRGYGYYGSIGGRPNNYNHQLLLILTENYS